ncbi:hypothetical protein QNH39_05215 [Neobacillus novalis]|uniref:Uncharacterized protein n=2 Tax=Neobacillus novalis TaxID=220687 RepID=A0AA95MNF4_9BACI|nr:hypothetical protein [Neobacillus novalis]WHY87259.1 hypothetical protein QNH39_05215 [Neobacillus novalis]
MKKKYPIVILTGIFAICMGIAIYLFTHTSIFNFRVSNSDFTSVIIQTKENNYQITDKKTVLKIAKAASKMKKGSKVDNGQFPPGKQYDKYYKLLFQTESKGTIGGSFWLQGDLLVIDSNGYYWSVSDELLNDIEKGLKNSKQL